VEIKNKMAKESYGNWMYFAIAAIVIVLIVMFFGRRQPSGYGMKDLPFIGDGDKHDSDRMDIEIASHMEKAPQGYVKKVGQTIEGFEQQQPQQTLQCGCSDVCVCKQRAQLDATELLPKSDDSKWVDSLPVQQNSELSGKQFLTAGHNIGINTVGQTLRNANLQLRSEPSNPQMKVSPWLQSTIDPDVQRRPLEIGGCD